MTYGETTGAAVAAANGYPGRALDMIIGILGGIGAGKSTVARLFEEAGCRVIDADRVGHDVLGEPAVLAALLERFGPEILGDSREASPRIDRQKLAARVFHSAADVEALNAITHPRIQQRIQEAIREHRGVDSVDAPRALVLDVSLLENSPLRHECDMLVFVEASEDVRIRRCRARGWKPGELERRARHQRPVEEKRGMAHRTIDNSGTVAATRRQVTNILREISKSLDPRGRPAGRPPTR